MKTPDYLSYERYKKRKNNAPNRSLFLFIATFLITLISFSVGVKFLSPDVDVSIGGNTEVEPKDTGLGVKRFIDERLKQIQQEDNSSGVIKTNVPSEDESMTENIQKSTSTKYEIQEEVLTLPENHDNAASEPVMPSYEQVKNPPRPRQTISEAPSAPVPNNSRVCKVYVGKYSTIEQARVAQEILLDAGLGVTPFIKDLNGSYTLQLGSFSSRAKADELASSMRRNGFPARISEE